MPADLERTQNVSRMRRAISNRDTSQQPIRTDAYFLNPLKDLLRVERPFDGAVGNNRSALAEAGHAVEIAADQAGDAARGFGIEIVAVEDGVNGDMADVHVQFYGAGCFRRWPQRRGYDNPGNVGSEQEITLRAVDVERPQAAQLFTIVFDFLLRRTGIAANLHGGDECFDHRETDPPAHDGLLRNFHPRQQAAREQNGRRTVADFADH